MKTILFNPFRYVAGFRSLIAGILILLVTACVGYLSHTHFPDLISVKVGVKFPLSYFILQSLSNWLVLSVLLYLFALVSSSSTIRIVDIFGTQALARFPYLIAAFTGFSASLEKFGKYVLRNSLGIGEDISLSAWEMVTAVSIIVLSLLLTIWMVTLMVNAFRISANLKGGKLAVYFIVAFIISAICTGLINRYLLITNFS
jgi:hypothetical protein